MYRNCAISRSLTLRISEAELGDCVPECSHWSLSHCRAFLRHVEQFIVAAMDLQLVGSKPLETGELLAQLVAQHHDEFLRAAGSEWLDFAGSAVFTCGWCDEETAIAASPIFPCSSCGKDLGLPGAIILEPLEDEGEH